MNKKRKVLSTNIKFVILAIPGITGFILVYGWPFLKTLYYSFLENTHTKNFVWFDNYKAVIENDYFRLALFNTAVFSAISVSAVMLISISLSFLLSRASSKLAFVKKYFILPVMIPVASVIYLWQTIFENGSYSSELSAVLPIYLIFIWRNTGMTVLIITSALIHIPKEIIDSASLDCSSEFKIFRIISLPMIVPELFFAGMLTFVSTLKIYKESNLYFGTDYPPDSAYTLQYYMNNHFHKLNFQTLTSATVVFTLIITVIVALFYNAENRISKKNQ